jgi:tetratricopeptide (TPR) repeat protein
MPWLWLVLCVASLFAPRLTRADDGDSPEYSEAVSLGVAEFDARNFIEARAHFMHAHTLRPNARTLRALGMVAFELKKYVESVDYLGQALASKERPLAADQQRQAEELFARANGYIARLTLQVTPKAELSVDGVPLRLPPDGALLLEAGDHVLELKAAGYISDRRKVEIRGGERETLRIALIALPRETGAGAARATSKRPVYKSPWLWTAVGVLVAGAAAGTAIALTHDGGSSANTSAVYVGNGGAPALKGPSE